MDSESWRRFVNIGPEACRKARRDLFLREQGRADEDRSIFDILDDLGAACPVCGETQSHGVRKHLRESGDERHRSYAAAREVLRG